jgi:hypothetical protein
MIVKSPLYLFHSNWPCWNCGKPMQVTAIAGVVIAEGASPADNELKDTAILEYITEIPQELLAPIKKANPGYSLSYSDTAEYNYYANVCPSCSTMSGDNYIMGVDGPFFVEQKQEAKRISYEQLPLEGEWDVTCNASWGMAEWFLENGKTVVRAG